MNILGARLVRTAVSQYIYAYIRYRVTLVFLFKARIQLCVLCMLCSLGKLDDSNKTWLVNDRDRV